MVRRRATMVRRAKVMTEVLEPVAIPTIMVGVRRAARNTVHRDAARWAAPVTVLRAKTGATKAPPKDVIKIGVTKATTPVVKAIGATARAVTPVVKAVYLAAKGATKIGVTKAAIQAAKAKIGAVTKAASKVAIVIGRIRAVVKATTLVVKAKVGAADRVITPAVVRVVSLAAKVVSPAVKAIMAKAKVGVDAKAAAKVVNKANIMDADRRAISDPMTV